MPSRQHSGQGSPRYGPIAIAVAVGIAYGSLYPFRFSTLTRVDEPIKVLLQSWSGPFHRGDFTANILLYIPFGCAGALFLALNAWPRFLIVCFAGGLLSASIELAQHFEPSRVTSASDVYANLLGTMIGAAGAIWISPARKGRSHFKLLKPIPLALLTAWVGSRLYPYVPTIDLHKYWDALKPVILSPVLSFTGLYHHTTIWLVLFALIATVAGSFRVGLLSLLFSAFLLWARVLAIGQTLSMSEVLGAFAALCLLPFLLHLSSKRRAVVLFTLLAAAVVIGRLQPFEFTGQAKAFGWVPFRSIMEGSTGTNAMTLLEKCFLYGSLIYLFTEAGGRLHLAALGVSGGLFTISCAQMYLPGRSAEITDALLSLLIAAGFSVAREDAQSRRRQIIKG